MQASTIRLGLISFLSITCFVCLAHTGSCILETLLDVCCQTNHMIGWPSPEDETIPRIFEARLNIRYFEPQQVLINDELFEVRSKELFLLLGVTLGAVGCVELPDFVLHSSVSLSVHHSKGLRDCTCMFVVAGTDKGCIGVLAGLQLNPRQVLQLVPGVFRDRGTGHGEIVVATFTLLRCRFKNKLFEQEK